jgi:hypothetical protein
MLKGLAGEQDQLLFEVPGSSRLEQSFRSMHVIESFAPELPEQFADYRNNARIKATARKCSLRLTEKAL